MPRCPLLVGPLVLVWSQPPQRLVASVLAFAAGTPIVSASFELFEPAYEGGACRIGLFFGVGALVFVVADTCLDPAIALASAAGFVTGFLLSH